MGVKVNPMLAKLEARIRNEERVARDVIVEIDMMSIMILLNDNFKVASGRAPGMLEEFLNIRQQIAECIVDDGKNDSMLEYSKHDLAGRMKQIFGENWIKVQHWFPLLVDYWEERG